MIDGQFKVRLVDGNTDNLIDKRSRYVQFDVTPDLIENRNVNYKTLDPMHAPGQIYVYANTSSRTFNISNIRLISRTPQEAQKNLERLWRLRSWCMPSFGRSNIRQDVEEALNQQRDREAQGCSSPVSSERTRANQADNQTFLGAPPRVLELSAYSAIGPVKGIENLGHIRRVPVVIQQLSIPYPSDTDYIPTCGDNPVPMPTIMTLDMTLVETHSPAEYQAFSLEDFKQGRLTGF